MCLVGLPIEQGQGIGGMSTLESPAGSLVCTVSRLFNNPHVVFFSTTRLALLGSADVMEHEHPFAGNLT